MSFDNFENFYFYVWGVIFLPIGFIHFLNIPSRKHLGMFVGVFFLTVIMIAIGALETAKLPHEIAFLTEKSQLTVGPFIPAIYGYTVGAIVSSIVIRFSRK